MRPAGATLRLFAQWLRPTTNKGKTKPSVVAFFAYYRVFAWVPADCVERHFLRLPALLNLRYHILFDAD